jgi:hypothetical protein
MGASFAYKEALDQKVLRTYEWSGSSFLTLAPLVALPDVSVPERLQYVDV